MSARGAKVTPRRRTGLTNKGATTVDTTRSTDSWENVVTGIGGDADKAANFGFSPRFAQFVARSDQFLEELYEYDDMAGSIIDIPVDDALRRGFAVESPEKSWSKEALTDKHDKLKTKLRVSQCKKWARLYGGSALLVGTDDGRPHVPLNYDRITEVRFLTAYARPELVPWRWCENPLDPHFGEPETYRLTPMASMSASQMTVHRSRLVIFQGVETTRRQFVANNGWGTSVLARVIKVISQFNGAFATVLANLASSNQDIYKIKGFADIVARGQKEILEMRLDVLQEYRSSINALVMDADNEDFARSQLTMTGQDEILNAMMLRICAASNPKLPLTKLFGQSPAGLSATGESDMRNYYDGVGTVRDEMTPAFERVTKCIFRSKQGPTNGVEPSQWSIKYPSLWQPTAVEQSQIDTANANSDDMYIANGTLTRKQVARTRFGSGGELETRIKLTDDELDAIPEEPTTLTGGETDPGVDPITGEPIAVDPDDPGAIVGGGVRLNGAQITAATGLLASIVAGTAAPGAARELLLQLGIEGGSVQRMLKATEEQKTEAETKEANAPEVTSGQPATA